MRSLAAVLALAAVFALPLAAPAQAQKVSRSPRELGIALLRDIAFREGILAFRVDSGGCTDASSFRVRASKEKDSSPGVRHYSLTIERIRADECKAMLWDGVLVEIDLARELGLSGKYTVSVANPVQGAEDRAGLNRALLGSTARAIRREIDSAQQKLKNVEEGTGPGENGERLRERIRGLEAEQVRFAAMTPADYPSPVQQESAAPILEPSSGSGPILPPVMREIVITVDAPLAEGSLLTAEGTSKSGPFYRLAGIAGGDYGILKKGKRYALTVCLVYRREYFGFIGDFYVHVLDAR